MIAWRDITIAELRYQELRRMAHEISLAQRLMERDDKSPETLPVWAKGWRLRPVIGRRSCLPPASMMTIKDLRRSAGQ